MKKLLFLIFTLLFLFQSPSNSYAIFQDAHTEDYSWSASVPARQGWVKVYEKIAPDGYYIYRLINQNNPSYHRRDFKIYGDGVLIFSKVDGYGVTNFDTGRLINPVKKIEIHAYNPMWSEEYVKGNGTIYYTANFSDQDTVIEARNAAISAKTSADTAANRAQTTVNQTWYSGTYGGLSESVSDLAGYIRSRQQNIYSSPPYKI